MPLAPWPPRVCFASTASAEVGGLAGSGIATPSTGACRCACLGDFDRAGNENNVLCRNCGGDLREFVDVA